MRLPDPLDDPSFYEHLVAKRTLSWLVDFAVTLAITLLALLMSLGLGVLMLPILWFAVNFAYRWYMLSRYSATLGMMLMAIRLRRVADGEAPDSDACLWYSAIFAASALFVVPQVVSVAMILVAPMRQSLGDVLMGMAMINRPLE